MPKTSNPLTQKRGPSTNVILTIVVGVVAAVIIGAVLLFNSTGDGDNAGAGNGGAPAPTVPAETLRKPDSHTLTEAPDNKVTVVEFLDYQCQSCKRYYDDITKQVEQDYAGRITFVTRNHPFDMHALAKPAAMAAEAAALQGKYKEMYHGLYDDWQSWAVAPGGEDISRDPQAAQAVFDRIAQRNGLDLAKFHQDMNSPQVQQRIDQDLADGQQAGVQGTPTIFVNGKKWEPSPDVATFADAARSFRQQLDQELGK